MFHFIVLYLLMFHVVVAFVLLCHHVNLLPRILICFLFFLQPSCSLMYWGVVSLIFSCVCFIFCTLVFYIVERQQGISKLMVESQQEVNWFCILLISSKFSFTVRTALMWSFYVCPASFICKLQLQLLLLLWSFILLQMISLIEFLVCGIVS